MKEYMEKKKILKQQLQELTQELPKDHDKQYVSNAFWDFLKNKSIKQGKEAVEDLIKDIQRLDERERINNENKIAQ